MVLPGEPLKYHELNKSSKHQRHELDQSSKYHKQIYDMYMCQRAERGNSLKMETQLCTTKAKTPPRKAIFPVLANLSFYRSLFEKEICIYIPSADSLKSLNNFLKRTFVFMLGGPLGPVRVGICASTYHHQNCIKNAAE